MKEPEKQRIADPIVDAYKKDVDRTLIRENLKLTHQERLEKLIELQRFARELQKAGREINKRQQ